MVSAISQVTSTKDQTPAEWPVVPLSNILKLVAKSSRRLHIQDEAVYTRLSAQLYAKGIMEKDQVQGATLKTKTWFRVQRGDFILLKIWARRGSYGFVTHDYHNPIVSSDYPIFELDRNQADEGFVAYFLSRADAWRALASGAKGSTNRQRVHEREFLQLIKIPLPPLPEQHAIAHVLRTVQRAKEATEAVVAAARELKKSLMRHLFSYGPVPVDEADQVPLKETEIGPVPQHWRVVRLDQCASVQTGVAKGRKNNDIATIEVPYLRVANVQDGYLDLSEIKTIRIAQHEVQRYQLHYGDVLVTEGGDFDKLGRGFIWYGQVPGAVHQNHIFAIRADSRLLLPEFLAYFVQTAYAKAYFLKVAHRTTHLACINSTKLKALPVLLPPLPEQARIVAILQAVEHKIATEKARGEALHELFATLLHHLMTGKLRVGDVRSFEIEEEV